MSRLSRRGFLAASAALSAGLILPAGIRAESAAARLSVTTRTLDVKGRAVTVFGLQNGAGGQGLTIDAGQRFRVDLTNAVGEEAIVHWHGQIPPNLQDGVPNTNPMLKPGETRPYDFAPRAGTFWMHSHIPVQELGLLAAPLIVRSASDAAADRQEVVMFLHDLSFEPPQEVLSRLTGGAVMDHSAMGHGTGMMTGDMAGTKDMAEMNGMAGMAGMQGMDGMAMDLNDVNFDAYLANDRTLDDPDVLQVERGGRVLLRIINGASMTAFWIDLGPVTGRLVAVDGTPCRPLRGRRFGLSPAQRLDIELDMPGDGSPLPVLALREGARERTGLILAPVGAAVARIPDLSDASHPAFSGDMSQEAALSALESIPERPVDRSQMVMLSGSMSPYVWTIDGQTWADHTPIRVRTGERIELTYHNMSMMAHPMHLHGHVFQVVAINGRRLSGAVRDTVHVPPMTMVTIAFDAGEPAPWMLHCHHMGHLETGMMTVLGVTP